MTKATEFVLTVDMDNLEIVQKGIERAKGALCAIRSMLQIGREKDVLDQMFTGDLAHLVQTIEDDLSFTSDFADGIIDPAELRTKKNPVAEAIRTDSGAYGKVPDLFQQPMSEIQAEYFPPTPWTIRNQTMIINDRVFYSVAFQGKKDGAKMLLMVPRAPHFEIAHVFTMNYERYFVASTSGDIRNEFGTLTHYFENLQI